MQSISRIKNCSGTYDLQIVISVRKEDEFIEQFETIINKYHNIVSHYDILEILDEDFLGLGLILNKEDIKNLSITEHKGSAFEKSFEKIIGQSQTTQKVVLDEKDKKILDMLKLDGSMSIKEISDKVGIAQIAVKNRIKKLILSGIIKRFMPLASLNKLGYQWWKVFFKLRIPLV